MSYNLENDNELWLNIQLNDKQAFTAFYNRHWKRVYKTLLYYLKDELTAEQVLQEVFVVLWEKRQVLVIENISNYLFITSKYQVFKHFRATRKSPIDFVESLDENYLSCRNRAEEDISFNELKQELVAKMVKLPKRCREIFWMSRVNQLSNEEIAIHFNISKRTVENQITVASKYLKTNYHLITSGSLLALFLS